MTAKDYLDLFLFVVSILLSIIGWLGMRQIDRQGQDIEKLFQMHHEDQAELTELKVKIAENYPIKGELRSMVQDIKDHLDERFRLIEQIARNAKRD